ncbi:MAG: NUDIX hydrolase [Erysipelotrichaceae bacterium]|nr:NUDIX hydrolase [Erysipelotrichaceae bacterium]
MRDLLEELRGYVPFNEQEEKDRKIIIELLSNVDDIYDRSNDIAHMTASAWVINRQHTKILMAYHNIYKSYSWLGGHADGDKDLLRVALREVQEESGLMHLKPVSDNIFSIEILPVNGHEKKGKYVASHLHINVTYLIEADSDEPLIVKPDENKALKWFDIDKAIDSSNEEWFKERIYSKLNAELFKYMEEQHEDFKGK